ncbi:DegV family protein [Spiroplasma endosymbiont of Atherix ibis]|uniref:DegV family protein n=1 Tax=Spiroplasma endosymbiont of Atherix ibis TaxID=3066291 RepID=UPI0030CB0D74
MMGENLTIDEFYKLNDSQLLKTSQSIPGLMLEKWNELLKAYEQIVCLLISKGLSGQYSTCKVLAKDDKYKDKVFVVDTNGVSTILRHQFKWALELVKQRKKGQEIESIIEKANDKFILYIIPKSLTQLVRGGRISKAAAGLAKFLKITPILKYNGEIDKYGKERTFKKAIKEVIKVLKDFGNENFIDISYSRVNEEYIDEVKKIIIAENLKISLLDNMPNTITCHTGKETFALAIWKK